MFHTRAIILSVKPYREYDELISFFTEKSGKRIVLARGSRKPTSKLATMIHGLCTAYCSIVEGRRYPILTSLDSVQDVSTTSGSRDEIHPNAVKYPPKNFYARYFLYALLALCDDILYEGDANEKLWHALSGALCTACTAKQTEKKEWIATYEQWLWSLMESLGHGVTVNKRPTRLTTAGELFAFAYSRSPYPLEPFAFINSNIQTP